MDYCKRCVNKKFGSTGIVCGLTDEKPSFTDSCPDFQLSEKVVKMERSEEYYAEQRDKDSFDDPTTDEQGRKKPAWIVFVVILTIFKIIRMFMRNME